MAAMKMTCLALAGVLATAACGRADRDAHSTEPPPPSMQEQALQAQAQAVLMEAQASQAEAQVKAKELEIKAAKLELDRLEIEHNMALKREELKLKGVELGYEMASGENVKAN